jgi:hypothetical protein
MKAERILVATQTAVALVAVALVSLLVPAARLSGPALLAELPQFAIFTIALTALGILGIWLPRGDVVDTTVAVAFFVAIVAQPMVAVGIFLLSRLLNALWHSRTQTGNFWMILERVSRRSILAILCYVLLPADLLQSIASNPSSLAPLGTVGALAVLFVALDMVLDQMHSAVRSQVPYLPLLLGSLQLQGWVLAANWSLAVLLVILYPTMQLWALFIVMAMLLLVRQSFHLLLNVRSSYTATVEVLARALEAYDPDRRGHAERVAKLAGDVGRSLGIHGNKLQSITYAALFHDVGKLGADEIDESTQGKSAVVLTGVSFMAASIPMLEILDTAAESTNSLREDNLLGAYIIARCSLLDSTTNMVAHDDINLPEAIGARLYVDTRQRVDKVLEKVTAEFLREATD